MNNNFYQWHDERMVAHEMQELNRAVEQDRLLKEAGLLGESWLARATNALRNLLVNRRESLQGHRTIEQRTRSNRAAP
jgi:hypothetical protein